MTMVRQEAAIKIQAGKATSLQNRMVNFFNISTNSLSCDDIHYLVAIYHKLCIRTIGIGQVLLAKLEMEL